MVTRIPTVAALENRMLARPTLTKKPGSDQAAAEQPKGQARPKEERFLFRVDGQTKRSFSSKDPAMAVGVTDNLWEMSDMVAILENWESVRAIGAGTNG